MKRCGVSAGDRPVVGAALNKAEETGNPAVAIELPDGHIVTGKTSDLLGSSSACLLNALKYMAGIEKDAELISSGKHQFSAPFAQLQDIAAKLFWQQNFPHNLLIARGIHYRSVAADDGEAEIYDLNGHRLSDLQKGVNIIKRGNKTTKVIIK